MKLLVSNVGSTSLKFKLFDMPEERVLCEAKIERVGSRDAAIMTYRSHLSGARFSAEGLCIPSYAEGIALFLEKLTGDETGVIKGVEEISAIGFKTVLSRGYYGVHELTDEVMENMREYLYIAPVHNAAYIEAIGQFRAVLPDVPMIGVFETAFHREIPLERALYSIPYEWYEKYGIRKMGYHGASHGYIAQQAAKLGRAERVISCHLGGSCSICAILDGKSVDNSFGFSLQTGVMHANRAGDIDPYIVPFLVSKGMELDDILHGLSKNGGLLGVSGVSNDLREVSAAAADGTTLAVRSYELPEMTVTLPDGTVLTEAASPAETAALERAEAFNSRFRDWAGADGFDEVTAWAEEELAFRTESGGNWTPYTLELDCSVYQTEQMVCIQAEYYSYTGGAHPNTVLLAWNFDLMTGQFFAPEILAADGQIFLDAVRDEIIRQIDMTPEAAVEAGYWEDYQDIAANWSSYAVSFNEEGMTVAFSPYEIACYAMGPQEFRLSYEQLAPHLNSHGRDLLGIGKN